MPEPRLTIDEITAALTRVGGLAPRLGIVFERHGGRLRCRMPIDARHVGAPDVAHGGAITPLLDTGAAGPSGRVGLPAVARTR